MLFYQVRLIIFNFVLIKPLFIYQLISEKRNPVALYYKVFSVFCPMVFQHILKRIVFDLSEMAAQFIYGHKLFDNF